MIIHELHKLYLMRGMLLGALGFFALALFCLSLALGPEQMVLNRCAPAFVWVVGILTFLFSTPFLLKTEYQEGRLDEIVLHPLPSAFYILSKITAETLLLGVPLLSVVTVFSPFFALSFAETTRLLLTLLIGVPALSALGIWGGLLTLLARGGGLLISLLILPLTLPLILLSLSVMEMARLGLDCFAPFCLLISASLFLTIIAVGAGQWAIRIAVEG